MASFDALLAVQDHDTVIDQLRHRRATLPERAELAALEQQASEVTNRLTEASGQRDEVAGRQSELEASIAASEARIAQIDKRMYSGEVSSSRDLQAMGDEIASLKRRCSMLEDKTLETMEEREPLDAEVVRLEGELAAIDERSAVLRVRIAEAEVVIDAEIEKERQVREDLAQGLPTELADQYERLRSKLGGVGAARVVNGSCTGCHLSLPAMEIDRIKRASPDALVFCDQCGRILVH